MASYPAPLIDRSRSACGVRGAASLAGFAANEFAEAQAGAAPRGPALSDWARAHAVLRAAGCRLVRNEWGAPTVLCCGVELDFRSAAPEIRKAWAALSVDDVCA